MVRTSIQSLEKLLGEAREKGCSQVKLQLYDNWEDMKKEQDQPSYPPEDYQLDMRYYNTVEFETEIIGQQKTDTLLSKTEGDTLIIRIALSDSESLLKNLGIDDAFH